MCFSKNISLFMTLLGGVSSIVTLKYINYKAAIMIFYFTLMQIIHYLGYTVIDKCDNKLNQTLSDLNYIHICFQPPIYLLGLWGLFEKYKVITPIQLKSFYILIPMAIVTSILSFLQMYEFKNPILNVTDKLITKTSSECDLCGEKCSFSGKQHIKFTLPLRKGPEYFTPGTYSHFLFFFIPLLFFNNTTRIISLFMFLSAFIPHVIYKLEGAETATTWCGISVVQIILIYYFIYFYKKK